MIGLCYKDLLTTRKQMAYYLAFIGIYAVLAVVGVLPPLILSGLLVLVGMMLPMTSFGYDDQARWYKYAAATPAGRQGMVAGKYLFALLCILGGAVLILLLEVALQLTGLLEQNLAEQLVTVLGCMVVVLLLDAVILPFFIKYGAEKSRTITMIVFLGIFGAFILLPRVFQNAGSLPAPPAWLISALPVLLALLAVGAYAVSYFISLGIMAKREL